MDVTAVQEAEKLGFWGVLVPDAYMWDAKDLNVTSDKGIDATMEPWIAMSYLAAKTERIRLGTFVTPIPLRPPVLLAKMIATLDNISDGRVILGVGAGATERMFEAYSVWDDALTRAEKAIEGLELMLKLWTQKKVDHHGKHYDVKGAVLEPKPVQRPHPLLLFGGAGKRMLRAAGRYADICFIPPWTKVTREEAKQYILKEACKFKREKDISFAFAVEGIVPPRYDYKEYIRCVEEAKQKGCEYFMAPFRYQVDPPWLLRDNSVAKEREKYLVAMRQFARDIMPSFAD